MFLRRSCPAPSRYLEWRIRLFGAGAILGMMGIFFEARWMIWMAIGVLVTGLLLRFLDRPGPEEVDPGDEGPDDPAAS